MKVLIAKKIDSHLSYLGDHIVYVTDQNFEICVSVKPQYMTRRLEPWSQRRGDLVRDFKIWQLGRQFPGIP